MSSVFSFLRPRAETPGDELPAEPTPGEATMFATSRAAIAHTLMTNIASTPDQALANILTILEDYLLAVVADHLPALPGSLPQPSVSATGVTERPLAIGNWRGMEPRGSFSAQALKGGRLEVGVRFQLWTTDPGDADLGIQKLQERLLAARDDLWATGFLRLTAKKTSLAEYVESLPAWRKTADYQVLYEFHYRDTDAESLIARILIDINSQYGESTIVTDEMVRWDDLAAPALEVRSGVDRPFRVGTLFMLAFLPDGWDGSEVTVSASTGGTALEHTFPSMRAFFEAFTLETGTVELGVNSYRAGSLVFPNVNFPDPIMLKGGDDIFRISYAASAFDNNAVVYLRVLS